MKRNVLTKTPIVWAVAGLCCLLWGSAFPAIKIGYRLFNIDSSDTASIILFAGIRFFLAGALTIAFFSVAQKKVLLPNKYSAPKIFVLSLFQTILQYTFFYLGLAFTTGERASVIQGTNVFIALIISSLIFKLEKLKLNKIIGCILGFAGVVLVSLDVFTQSANKSYAGEIMVLICTVSYAFSSVFMKKYSESENPAMLSGWQFVVGGAVMTTAALVFGGRIYITNVRCVLLLIYLAMVSAAAYSLWSILLKYNHVSKVAVCGSMTPVFGFILSGLLNDNRQQNRLISIIALVIVALGIVVVHIPIDKKE